MSDFEKMQRLFHVVRSCYWDHGLTLSSCLLVAYELSCRWDGES